MSAKQLQKGAVMETDKNFSRMRERIMYENGHRHGYAAGKVAAREEMLVLVVIGLILYATFTMLSSA